ncbi:NAD(P)/FAD-dependent oxidoreductase [Bradyrhizobium tropiciagri]|uniref:flavin-containing monooxygenase n=1 Tax=Bradyrhizobium tropiciagri TaxID=312253 RepID=UPI001BA530E3|nr:NAD(P)/FAD-dependent oxidoreductase [Bradyrhizobium tropiciagri]MBR0900487.1 NAD(P)/FAD-dependent oxidoreductase [Bradyrhizobium tropiciagri]
MSRLEQTSPDREARPPLVAECDAVVVGAGFGGLYAIYRLRELGLKVIGIEAAADVGGTWYWNRYPGARCDIPSLLYSYTWSEELRQKWRWSEKYAAQPEILRYARHVADRFELRSLIRFDTRVIDADWDEAGESWTVRTDRGDCIVASFCVMATGNLSVPNKPKLPGLERFRGPVYHTGQWPHQEVDFSGLRVAVIGTGSSGVQTIPMVAKAASRLTVFQRTPNYSVPARNAPLSDADIAAAEPMIAKYRESLETPEFGRVPANAFDASVPARDVQWARYEQLWEQGGGGILTAFPNILTDEAVNDVACDFVRDKIRGIVDDAATAEVLSPKDYPLGVKRICIDTGYFATYNLPHVELVDLRAEPLTSVTEGGVETATRSFALDALVLATGYDAMTGALAAMRIRGRDGATLNEAWADGPRAYLGLMVSGFPNLFVVTGPGSPSVIGNVIHACENHVEWITTCLAGMRAKGQTRIEPEPDAERAWMAHVADAASRTLYPKANSWYQGANIAGKPRVFMPYVGQGYRHRIAQIAQRGYEGFVLR